MKLYAVWNLTGGFATSPGQFIAFQLRSPLCIPFSWWPLTLYLSLPSDGSSHQPLSMCNNVKHPPSHNQLLQLLLLWGSRWRYVISCPAVTFLICSLISVVIQNRDSFFGSQWTSRGCHLGNQVYKFSIFETHIFTNFHSYSRIHDYSIVRDDFIVRSGHHLCNKIDHIRSAVSRIFFALMVLLAIPLAVLFYQFC